PDRWAPTWANIGLQDRGASLRVCPVFGLPAAHHFNLEYRVADAAACPYLALGALVWAGVDGIRRGLTLADPPERNFGAMSAAERGEAGIRPLSRSLDEALDRLAASPTAHDWFGDAFFAAYLQFKRAELRALDGLSPAEICARYA